MELRRHTKRLILTAPDPDAASLLECGPGVTHRPGNGVRDLVSLGLPSEASLDSMI